MLHLGRCVAVSILASAAVACGLTTAGSKIDDVGAGADASLDATRAGDAARPDAVADAAPLDPADADADAADDASAPDADAASPDAGPTTAVGPTAVAATSLTVDLVSLRDGAIAGDGFDDGLFDVEVTGPSIALAVVRTDAAGAPSGSQQWDTWTGADAIPADLGTGFVVGVSTYHLGVYDAGGVLLNDANGRLVLPAGVHALRVAGANVGSFAAGRYFRVVAQRPDGTLVRGPVVAY